MTLLQYGIAQIGRPSARKSSLAMLVEPTDLPGGGWRTIGERSFRIGFRIGASEVARSARHTGAFASSRYFEQAPAMSRYCWLEVMPYASAADAKSVLPDLETSIVRDPRTEATGVGRRIEPQEAPEVADYPFVYETPISGRNGPSTPRMVGGIVAHVVFVVSCSEAGPGWSWSEVAPVGAAQALKIRTILDASSQSETG
jgi:hypothetical protein